MRSRTSFTIGVCALLIYVHPLGAEITGWRGDGTGKYPAATPPLNWSQSSTRVETLRFSAETPIGADAGSVMQDGVIRDWLVVGPLPLSQRSGAEPSALPDEPGLAPVAGQEAGTKKWRKVTVESAYLDFTRLVGKPEDDDSAAFAFTNIYSPLGGRFRLSLTTVGHARLWVNGKPSKQMGTRIVMDLAKGWNRLLLRVTRGENDWYVVPVFRGEGRCDYDQSGIVWRTSLPGTAPGFTEAESAQERRLLSATRSICSASHTI